MEWNDAANRENKVKKFVYEMWHRTLLPDDQRRYQACENRDKRKVAKAKELDSRIRSEDLDKKHDRQKVFQRGKANQKG